MAFQLLKNYVLFNCVDPEKKCNNYNVQVEWFNIYHWRNGRPLFVLVGKDVEVKLMFTCTYFCSVLP